MSHPRAMDIHHHPLLGDMPAALSLHDLPIRLSWWKRLLYSLRRFLYGLR
jgi:hypothetical protein